MAVNIRKLNLNCTCGATWRGILDKAAADKIEATFNEAHTGPGHVRCNSAAAARRRRREESKVRGD
jgi:hypothetical protein